MKIKEISRCRYDEFLSRLSSYSFLQTSAMNEVLKSNKRKTKLLALVADDDILAVGLAFIRKFHGGERIDFMVGASSLEEKYEYIFYDLLKKYAKENGYLKLVVKLDKDYFRFDDVGNIVSNKDRSSFDKMKEVGYIENDGTVPDYDGSPDFQYIINLKEFLPNSCEKLLKSFNKNAQRRIKKAKELGIYVRKIAREEMKDFRLLTSDTAKKQGFNDKSLDYYYTFFDEFGEKTEFLTSFINLEVSIKLIEDEIKSLNRSSKNKQKLDSLNKDLKLLRSFQKDSDRNIIGLNNMILVYGKKEAIYFLGGSLARYNKLPGAFILQYEAMKRIMAKNIPIYNLYGVDGVFDGSDTILKFKQNFGGYTLSKTGAFIYYPFGKE